MKISFLYILFFSSFVFSQQKIPNITSISLAKLYDVGDDGPCNNFIYNGGWPHISKQIKDCDNLVLQLIKYKQQLKMQKGSESCCGVWSMGCGLIENMIVYQYNKLTDTIYFNADKNAVSVIDYKRHKEYSDSGGQLLKILFKNKSLKEFYDADIDKLNKETLYFELRDTANIDDIKINNKSVYKLSFDEMDKAVDTFYSCKKEYTRIMGNWELDYAYTEYNKNMNLYYFSKEGLLAKIIIRDGLYSKDDEYHIDVVQTILDISVGDSEQKLIERFPNSTKQIKNLKKYFKENNGDYTIYIKLSDDKGYVDYILNDSKIKQIEINFKYPNN